MNWVGPLAAEAYADRDVWFNGWSDKARNHVLLSIEQLKRAAALAQGKGCVIQAGGCHGLYPYLLSRDFARVVTFEPDPDNYDRMQFNLSERINEFNGLIDAYCAALVEQDRLLSIHQVDKNPGGTSVFADDEGLVKGVALDNIYQTFGNEWGPVSMIQLDVEGAEEAAILGGKRVIQRFHPVIMYETCHDRNGATRALLESWGYILDQEGENDDIMVWGEEIVSTH